MTDLRHSISELLVGASLEDVIDQLFEAVCPSCGDPGFMVNFAGSKDCPKVGCVHYKGRALAQKPFLKEYHEWVAATKYSREYEWKNMGDALHTWVKRNARHDVTKARKIITKILEKPLLKKGLKLDYMKDTYTFRVDKNYASYRIMAITKRGRVGSPGGDHLVDVILEWYPDGHESYRSVPNELNQLLGAPSAGVTAYDKFRDALRKEFKRVFPDKTYGTHHRIKGLKVP